MTSLYHERILYFDLELTCWDSPPPPGMITEIIEIGIVEMELETLAILREKAFFVRPRRWEITQKCTDITGITASDIQNASPLEEVLPLIQQQFDPAAKSSCAWGDDHSTLSRKCKSMGLTNPFRRFIDLSKAFQGALAIKDSPSLAAALDIMGMSFDGVPHGALPDARNLAHLHAALLRRMRRLADPIQTPALLEPVQTTLSPFAQKLADCLK